MNRRDLLTAVASTGVVGLAGCSAGQSLFSGSECPDNPITDTSLPADRRSVQFPPEEKATIDASEGPNITYEPSASRVTVRGTFLGASSRGTDPKDMVIVDRLRYESEENTLRVRLDERRCESQGSGGGGGIAPYILKVDFPDELPGRVCVQEREAADTSEVCVSRE